MYGPISGGSSVRWNLVWQLYRPLKGLPCDVRQRKVLGKAIDEVSGALSMHVTPPAIQTIVVPTRMTILLGLRNPPRSWTGTVDPSLTDFTIAPCVDSLMCYRSIKWPKSVLQDSPEV
jgi:hypothetical protein